MAVHKSGCWLPPLLLLFSVLGAAAEHTSWQGTSYVHRTLLEVMEVSVGVTRLCVMPMDDNTKLKVRHTEAEGRRQEVVIKKKLLAADTLIVLEIEVAGNDADKASLSVWLNGTQLQPTDGARRPITSSSPLPPTTQLLLKGNANIADCTADQEEKIVLNKEPKVRTMAVTEENGGEVTEGQGGEVTEGQGSEEIASTNALVSSLTSSTSTNVTDETEVPDSESGKEDPWWSFILVLGKVGNVPVLLLLLACLVVGVVVGSILVCLCSKVCQKRRVKYLPVSTRRTHSGHLAGDIVRDPNFWDALSNKQRSSGIGSAYSTLNTDNGSYMGTTNSRGTGTRPVGSANNSMDRSTIIPTHIGVNNLGRGVTGSPSTSINRSRNNSSGNVLNIPNGNGMTRSSSSKSTGSSDNRDADRSPMLLQGNSVGRTSSNKSTSSSINRNTNRSPNIPYTKKLGFLAGHQDTSLLQDPVNKHCGSDEDSEDDSYDKPYISPPIVAENYSVPHVSSTQPVHVGIRTTACSTNDPNARQVPVSQLGTARSTNDPTARQVPVFQFETFRK